MACACIEITLYNIIRYCAFLIINVKTQVKIKFSKFGRQKYRMLHDLIKNNNNYIGVYLHASHMRVM